MNHRIVVCQLLLYFSAITQVLLPYSTLVPCLSSGIEHTSPIILRQIILRHITPIRRLQPSPTPISISPFLNSEANLRIISDIRPLRPTRQGDLRIIPIKRLIRTERIRTSFTLGLDPKLQRSIDTRFRRTLDTRFCIHTYTQRQRGDEEFVYRHLVSVVFEIEVRYRIKIRESGEGLGLSVCSRVVSELDGLGEE